MGRVRRPSPQTTAVLSALAEEPARWSYGYELCRSLGLKAGTVYPILIRLAERGDVDTAWEEEAPSGRPPRHLYRLSARGAEYVEKLRSASATRDRQAFMSSSTALEGPAQ
jgi:PadR family transcriptional regulator PadR